MIRVQMSVLTVLYVLRPASVCNGGWNCFLVLLEGEGVFFMADCECQLQKQRESLRWGETALSAPTWTPCTFSMFS